MTFPLLGSCLVVGGIVFLLGSRIQTGSSSCIQKIFIHCLLYSIWIQKISIDCLFYSTCKQRLSECCSKEDLFLLIAWVVTHYWRALLWRKWAFLGRMYLCLSSKTSFCWSPQSPPAVAVQRIFSHLVQSYPYINRFIQVAVGEMGGSHTSNPEKKGFISSCSIVFQPH